MEITFKFTDDEMRNPEVIRETILKLFGNPVLREDIGQLIEEVGQPIKTSKNRINIVEELEDFANKISPTLTSEAQKKSLKKFVEFYKKKILEDDFKINDFNKTWTKWISREKNK